MPCSTKKSEGLRRAVKQKQPEIADHAPPGQRSSPHRLRCDRLPGPDLQPCRSHRTATMWARQTFLFPKLKKSLKGRHFDNVAAIEWAVKSLWKRLQQLTSIEPSQRGNRVASGLLIILICTDQINIRFTRPSLITYFTDKSCILGEWQCYQAAQTVHAMH